MGVFLGLMTYFVHGVLNNYFDTDKASAALGFFACSWYGTHRGCRC